MSLPVRSVKDLIALARDFARREIAPHVLEWDEKSEFPMGVVKELGKLGLMGARGRGRRECPSLQFLARFLRRMI